MSMISNPSHKSQWPKRLRVFAVWAWPLLAIVALVILFIALPGYDRFTGIGDRMRTDNRTVVAILSFISAAFSLLAAFVSLALAGLLFWRKRESNMGLFLAYFFVLYGIVMTGPLESAIGVGNERIALVVQTLFMPLFLALLYTFPSGRFVPKWSKWLMIPMVLTTPIMFLVISEYMGQQLQTWVVGIAAAFMLAVIGVGLYGQVYRYRYISSPRERLQTKWVIYGLSLWIGLVALGTGPFFYLTRLPPETPIPPLLALSSVLWWLGLTVIPISFSIAVLRYQLWDIDILINRTLVYAIVTGLLLLTYFSAIILLQTLFSGVSGQSSPLAIVISTLTIAALFSPLRSRVQAAIDRRFYRRKYDAAKTLARFAQTARNEVELEALSVELLQVVQDTMQPEHMSLWLKDFDNLPSRRLYKQERESAAGG